MINMRKLASVCYLVLVLGTASAAYGENTSQYIDDAAITTKVKAALVADTHIKATGISVETDHGTVQLSGTVDTKEEESQAVMDANQVKGVNAVKDLLVAKGMQ